MAGQIASQVLIPVKGCWVADGASNRHGVVRDARECDGTVHLNVNWIPGTDTDWVPLRAIKAGFKIGMYVQEVPYSRTRKSLGEGVVIDTRRIGERDQVLVDYYQSGQKIWIPYENLRAIKGVQQRFVTGNLGKTGEAERFRLRALAYALDMWHQNTGSLSRLDIDPLPHQIHLVHHILASGNLNWLIADDVGLGKTIEVGMLLAALERRGLFRRILLVTPAGLVRQWQEELHHKFGMSDYEIYGADFHINNPRHWKMHDHVIGSIDRFKSEAHFNTLMKAGNWDLIVFDEAHRLSRRQWGLKYESSDRFRLAAALRKRTDSLLFLSATPHQGMQDKFQALLELLRPELLDQIKTLTLNPEILREMVVRNNKADVTDAEGNFVFRGKKTTAIEVSLGTEEQEYDKKLQQYFREGYEASKRKGKKGLAIGFVMTVYRKLAASSIAAIQAALERRIEKLRGEHKEWMEESHEDERYSGEQDEIWAQSADANEFFDGEIKILEQLLVIGRGILRNDRKLEAFIRDLIGKVHASSADEKILIFTEYRATQEYLLRSLSERYGESTITKINGGMTYEEREQAIASFESSGLFLISTEAGGEGLNLHRKCHVMVNYDLPWNPMRLVQRIGRLYRYGQKNKVVVFNMHAPQTMDAQIMNMMYARIMQVVQDMAAIGDEFRAGLEDEILGELSEVLDVESILEEASLLDISRTQDRIDEALARARASVEKQRELFEHAAGFNPDEARGELAINSSHVRGFVEGMLHVLGIEVTEITHGGRVLTLQLPESVHDDLLIRTHKVKITFDRDLTIGRPDIQMMDMECELFRYFLEKSKSYDFGGTCAGLAGINGRSLMTAILRWQNDQGVRMREEYMAMEIGEDAEVNVNSPAFLDWLTRPAEEGGSYGGKEEGILLVKASERAMNNRLTEISNRDIHPENCQLVNAGWANA